MTNTPFNTTPNEPSLKDLLDKLKNDIFLNMNCHHIGTVQTFNPTAQTVTATINYKKSYYKLNQETKKYGFELIDYPILIDCPVIFLGGGKSNLTFPVSKGDECLILFNDRNFDNWFIGANNLDPATSRLHSFADAIVIIGIRSVITKITNFDSSRAVLRNKNAYVGVGEDLIKIANTTKNLNTLLQSLITSVKDLVTATSQITVTGVSSGLGTSGVPSNVAQITAISSTLTTIANDLGGLLE